MTRKERKATSGETKVDSMLTGTKEERFSCDTQEKIIEAGAVSNNDHE